MKSVLDEYEYNAIIVLIDPEINERTRMKRAILSTRVMFRSPLEHLDMEKMDWKAAVLQSPVVTFDNENVSAARKMKVGG